MAPAIDGEDADFGSESARGRGTGGEREAGGAGAVVEDEERSLGCGGRCVVGMVVQRRGGR